ncbi:Rho termination factor N-terminal domain-containing protein, partial [Trebonia sp.]|uniref:Rho termination factor N-terminal domain-containing protein n=2 Tax=Trebonia sp. TaxID=2767075 RepID=UPI003BB1350D
MSDTTDLLSDATPASGDSPIGHSAASAAPRSSGRGGDDLSKLRVSDLQGLAQQLGISVTARMRKGDLVAAIQERRGGGRSATARTSEESVTRVASAGAGAPRPLNQDAMEADTSVRSGIGDAAPVGAGLGDAPRTASGGQAGVGGDRTVSAAVQQSAPAGTESGADGQGQGAGQAGRRGDRRRNDRRDGQGGNARDQRRDGRDSGAQGGAGRGQNAQNAQNGQNSAGGNARDDDDEDGQGRRGRRDRFRNRNRRRGDRPGGEPETVIAEDDVLIPIAGILDVLENYAFVRTTGYLPGPNDVYVSLSQVRKHGLRKGDVIEGAVRQPRDGERREKFNALVRLDKVNGLDPEQST